MPSEPTTDLSFLEENMMGEADIILEVIDLYLAQVPDFLDALRTAHGEEDWGRMRYAAHKMRSSAATVGARGLAEVLDAIEGRTAALRDLGEIPALVERAVVLGEASVRELLLARKLYLPEG